MDEITDATRRRVRTFRRTRLLANCIHTPTYLYFRFRTRLHLLFFIVALDYFLRTKSKIRIYLQVRESGDIEKFVEGSMGSSVTKNSNLQLAIFDLQYIA